jgi:hypothetical protein
VSRIRNECSVIEKSLLPAATWENHVKADNIGNVAGLALFIFLFVSLVTDGR